MGSLWAKQPPTVLRQTFFNFLYHHSGQHQQQTPSSRAGPNCATIIKNRNAEKLGSRDMSGGASGRLLSKKERKREQERKAAMSEEMSELAFQYKVTLSDRTLEHINNNCGSSLCCLHPCSLNDPSVRG